MKKITNIIIKSIAALAVVFLVSACANTSITQSWMKSDDAVKHRYKHPMVIVISDSQQTRRIYEDSLIAALQDHNISATQSYLLIDAKQPINREVLEMALTQAKRNLDSNVDIDSVVISYLAALEEELAHQDSPLGTSYSGAADDNMLSATLITGRGRFNNKEVIPLKTDVYDMQTKSIVWSVQTKTEGLTSIDKMVLDVTEVLADKLADDGLFE